MTVLFSTAKVGKILDKSPRWVKRNLVDTGRLKAVRIGRDYRIPEADVEAYIGALLHRRTPRKQIEREVQEARAFFGHKSEAIQ